MLTIILRSEKTERNRRTSNGGYLELGICIGKESTFKKNAILSMQETNANGEIIYITRASVGDRLK